MLHNKWGTIVEQSSEGIECFKHLVLCLSHLSDEGLRLLTRQALKRYPQDKTEVLVDALGSLSTPAALQELTEQVLAPDNVDSELVMRALTAFRDVKQALSKVYDV